MKKIILVILFITTSALTFFSHAAYTGLYYYFVLGENEGGIGASIIMIASLPFMFIYGLTLHFNRSLLRYTLIKLSTIPFILIVISDFTVLVSQLISMYT